MQQLFWPAKDPNEILDYSIDWSARLRGNDLITASSFTVSNTANLAIVANSFNNSVTTVWLAAGSPGRVAEITNHITTSAGRQFQESVTLTIIQK